MDRKVYLSYTAAAKRLGVGIRLVPKIAEMHNLKVWRIPGHTRAYLLREEVEALAAKALGTTGARA